MKIIHPRPHDRKERVVARVRNAEEVTELMQCDALHFRDAISAFILLKRTIVDEPPVIRIEDQIRLEELSVWGSFTCGETELRPKRLGR